MTLTLFGLNPFEANLLWFYLLLSRDQGTESHDNDEKRDQ